MKIKVKNTTPEIFMKRAFWLAWQACGGTMGMGFFRDRPEATEEDVWKNVCSNGDYVINTNGKNEFYGDYVFGRMVKWGGKVEDGIISFYGSDDFDRSYQGFARKYPNSKVLLDATAKSLKCSYSVEKKNET